MIYKPKKIGVYIFSEKAMYRLDLMKWNQEAQERIKKIRLDFYLNRNNKHFNFNSSNYPLRPMPILQEQAQLI